MVDIILFIMYKNYFDKLPNLLLCMLWTRCVFLLYIFIYYRFCKQGHTARWVSLEHLYRKRKKMKKNDWSWWFRFLIMTNTMNYLDLVGDDCMEKIMETSANQLEESIDSVVKKLRKYATVRYKEEDEVSKDKFSMNCLILAVASRVLKTA